MLGSSPLIPTCFVFEAFHLAVPTILESREFKRGLHLANNHSDRKIQLKLLLALLINMARLLARTIFARTDWVYF